MVSWHRLMRFLLALAAGACGAETGSLEIPYRKYVLDNGLTLLVHEDRKAPIAAVNIWYHVGSKDERPGRTGFAHLFEHLMFNGSEHFDDDYFKALERVGATGMNGTTGEDRTNYFQEVPREALDVALWMESDRMGHLLGAVSQARLDEQRGVVLNEKRQSDNQPYRLAWRLITQNTWPAGHPYSWEVIGSDEDLAAATLEDVRAWFKQHYGAANAVLAVAGDVEADEVFGKVKRFFGDIPPGPPVCRDTAFIAKRSGVRRMRAQDRVSQARLYKIWNIPPYGTTEGNLLTLTGELLSGGKSSRLYKRLVYDEQLATDVYAGADLREIAGQFMVVASAKPGVALSRVEQAVDEELARFLKKGPTADELRRVKARFEADFVRGCERVGGFGGKSDILASNFVLTGDPEYYKTVLRETREATRSGIQAAAQAWLADGPFVLEIEPYPQHSVATSGVDRSALPAPELKPAARFPEVRRAVLANGLKVVLAERHEVPLVQFNMAFDAGFAADDGALPGTASLFAELLDEGTRRQTALELGRALESIGAQLGAGCNLDETGVSLNTLKRHLDAALELYADVILNPVFPEREFLRLQNERLAAIRREKTEPNGLAMRLLPQLLYGKGHAYGNPSSGSGDEASVARLTRDDMRRFHDAWFKPNNATLVVVGDTSLAELVPRLERLFGGWRPGAVPAKRIGGVSPPAKPSLYLLDRPSAPQAVLFAGAVTPPKKPAEEFAAEAANSILGGAFTSRVNMNLREDKHWSYGARTSLSEARGARVFLCVAPVQADKAAEAMRELDREFRGMAGATPPTEKELKKAVTDLTLQLTGRWETLGAVAGSLGQAVRFGLPDGYFQTYAEAMRALTQSEVAQTAARVIRPESLTWLVVGDRTKIEAGLRQLGWGAVTVLDAEGKPID